MAEKLSSPRVQLPVLPVPETKYKLSSPAPKELPVLPPPSGTSQGRSSVLSTPNESRFRRVAAITDISNTAWRDELLPAHFDGRLFHVESGSRESGRRIVVHEFPKRDIPYSEDMGRSAITFTVRGYIIVYPHNDQTVLNQYPNTIYQRDYRYARNFLQERLDAGGAGLLQLPTFRPVRCYCQRYRMTEEQKFGGYVVFDMQFVEEGKPPFRPQVDTVESMKRASEALKETVLGKLARPYTPSSALPKPVLPARTPR